MSLHTLAHHLQSAGRNGDSVLVHMTPGEVQGLQALAMAHGGSLTINPHTGLPEASFLSSLLPAIAGFALGPAGFGLMSATQAGLLVGGVTTLATGSLSKGIMAGFGAYGGAELGGALSAAGAVTNAGAGGAGATGAADIFKSLSPQQLQTVQAASAAGKPLGGSLLAQAATTGAAQQEAIKELIAKTATGTGGGDLLGGLSKIAPAATTTAAPSLGSSAIMQGVKNVTSSPEKLWNFVKENPYAIAGIASSISAGQQQPGIKVPERPSMGPIRKLRYEYDAPIAAVGTEEANYFPNARYVDTGEVYAAGGGLMGLAEGGPVEQMSQLNAIGANTMYPMANQMSYKYSTPRQRPISENVVRPEGDARLDPYTGEMRFAEGGDVASAFQAAGLGTPTAAQVSYWSGVPDAGARIAAAAANVNAANAIAAAGPRSSYVPASGITGSHEVRISPTETVQLVPGAPGYDFAKATPFLQQIANTDPGLRAYLQSQGISTAPIAPIGTYAQTQAARISPTETVQLVPTPIQTTPTGLAGIALQKTPTQTSTSTSAPYQAQTKTISSPTTSSTTTNATGTSTSDIPAANRVVPTVPRPLVPKILYDQRGMAMIEGGTPYNPAQYGYPGAVIPAIPYPFSTDGTFVPVTPGGTQPPETQQPGGTQPPGTETPGGTTPDGTAPGGTTPGGTQAPISQDPNAYKYNYWDNSQEDNRLVKEFQTGSNPKARADLVELYLTELGRLPDAAGFNYWLGEFGSEVDPKEAQRFLDNAQREISQRKSLESVYRDVGKRDVDIPGLEYWMGEIGRAGGIDPIKGAITAGLKKEIDMGNAGYSPAYTRDLLANLQNKTPEQISAENAKAPFLYGTIPNSQSSQYPEGRDNNQARAELYQLYKNNLGREPDLAGFDYWINTEGFGNDNVIDPQERSRFLERAKQLGETVKMAYGGLAGLSRGMAEGGNVSREAQVRKIYQDVLGRAADDPGLQYYTTGEGNKYTEAQLANMFGGSREGQIQKLYRDVLGRSADRGGMEYYLQGEGRTLNPNQIAEGFRGSEEYKGRQNPVVTGTAKGQRPLTRESILEEATLFGGNSYNALGEYGPNSTNRRGYLTEKGRQQMINEIQPKMVADLIARGQTVGLSPDEIQQAVESGWQRGAKSNRDFVIEERGAQANFVPTWFKIASALAGADMMGSQILNQGGTMATSPTAFGTPFTASELGKIGGAAVQGYQNPNRAGSTNIVNKLFPTPFGSIPDIEDVEIFNQGGQIPKRMAFGGLSNLGSYSDGGRLLKGPGDGVSDSIPAVIGNRQPARLADGEFVIPARIVSELGNGSTDAGARKLYAMMDRIQRARKKSTGKEKVAVNSRAEKYLPA